MTGQDEPVTDISKSNDDQKALTAKLCKAGTIVLIAAFLPGCVGAGLDMFGGDKVDRSISTNTVSTGRGDGRSDEATVQNAVSSADLAKIEGKPLPWANASTGSAGVVSRITEERDSGTVCRQFRTTRHAYDGIASFDGKTCLMNDGKWQLLAFNRQN